MRIRRYVCLISFFLVLLISISAYGPHDFMGLMGKITIADATLSDGAGARVSGQIYHKEIKNDKPVYFVKDATIEVDNVKLFKTSFILYPDSDTIPNKSKITATGTVGLFSVARNQGNFDEKSFYNSKGLVCKVTNVKIEEYRIPRIFSKDLLYRLQRNISMEYQNYLPGEEAGFLSSVVVGDKSELEGELKELFSKAGVAHILAVSGLHVSFLCMGLYEILRKRGISFLMCSVSSGSFAIMYAIMTGLSVSSFRAVGMFVIYLISQVLGENYDTATSLAVVADLLLIENPLLVKNMSFIFSFASIVGILLLAKPLSQKVDMKTRFGKSLVFSLGITLATLPILELMNYQMPTYSLFLNLIIIPLMPLLLGLGLLGGLFKLTLPLTICHYIIFIFECLADLFVKIPGSTIVTGRPSLVKVIIYYSLLAIIIGIPIISKKRRLCLVFVCFIFMVLPQPRSFEINVLDVGQGDGIFISCGGYSDIFIDGGSTSEKEVGKYRIEPFLRYKGAGDIDYWFITHGDEDHYNGFLELIESGYRVKNLVVGKNAVMNNNLLFVIKKAEEHGVNVLFMDKGQRLRLSRVYILCVFPGAMYSDDPNTQSLSLLVERGEFSGFFGGDITGESELKLTGDSLIKKVDYLKVSHHGSKTSTEEAFLQRLSPDVATISCARHNSYGHPAVETLNKLSERNISVYRTDRQGQISIIPKGSGTEVKLFLSQ